MTTTQLGRNDCVLIANRGEIALRIQRAASSLGLRTATAFTISDRAARHVQLADEAWPIEGELGYLDGPQLIEIAKRSGATLIHPGYGFLSENAEFAQACVDEGLTFVGPSPAVLNVLGDKAQARSLAVSLDIPVLSATGRSVDLAEAEAFLADLGDGSGVIVKAVAGGGGRGMRVVTDPADLEFAFERCRSEALRAFGNGDVYVEQLLRQARHVEVQVVGDSSGEVSHLWDRECSVQRRHQKLIEMAPCVTLTIDDRRPLLQAATRMAQSLGYGSLGTFEFLVDADHPNRFYFLEANPRLQVEHTVTEEITGVDLVRTQLELASGRRLSDLGLTQSEISEPRGIAIQCRINLEELMVDGTARATSGTLDRFEPPAGPGVRVDTGGYQGLVTTTQYDSLLAKVITHVPHQDIALAAVTADSTLAEFNISGPATNLAFLRAILQSETFRSGDLTTGFVDQHLADFIPESDVAAGAGPETNDLTAPFSGTAVSVLVADGDRVNRGTALVVLEAMKMEHVLSASASGTVREVAVAPGSTIEPGMVLLRLDADAEQTDRAVQESEVDLEHVREDLQEVLDRHRVGLDESRPKAVAVRRQTGHRTARENINDLCDPGTFTEFAPLTVAAQRSRRSLDDLITNTPADGLICGVARINSEFHKIDRTRAVVLSYDYTVMAGTQGVHNHSKTDRMLELAEKQRLPVVLFAEGGGGRPGDTDHHSSAWLDETTFVTMGRLSGSVPTVGITTGRCFAGNAALLGCCDVVIATKDANIGMGGPAMIEGGGLGRFLPEEIGPSATQVANGVIDILVENEAEAVSIAKRYLSYFQGPTETFSAPEHRLLRHVVPANRMRSYNMRDAVAAIADVDSVLELRSDFAPGIITALVRIDGRPMGLIANNPMHLGGAIDAPAADKMARFLQLCDVHGLPLVSLCDTPGFMVGPDSEATATVRHFARLFVVGAHLSVPIVAVVLRKAYGLGAMAMLGGSLKSPVVSLAWPTGELGPMGLEGSVRLGFRRELDAIVDEGLRQSRYDELLAEAYNRSKAINAAMSAEIDDVIDPADTRQWIRAALPPLTATSRDTHHGRFVDTW